MCDVPSTAVFYSESIECFPGTASKFFLTLLLLLLFPYTIIIIIVIIINNIFKFSLVLRRLQKTEVFQR
jgi:hypothetical protein